MDHKQNYLKTLQLKLDPFSSADVPALFYADAYRQQQFNLILHLAAYTNLLLIVGPEGVGKTALIRQCLRKVEEQWQICEIKADPHYDHASLLREIGQKFNIRAVDAEMKSLLGHFNALQKAGKNAIIFIDDAHQLNEESRDLLTKLMSASADKQNPVHIILSGQIALQSEINASGLSAVGNFVTHTIELRPFTLEETGHYIRHRLRAVGLKYDGAFTDNVIQQIHKRSRGIPAAINQNAQRVLVENIPLFKPPTKNKGNQLLAHVKPLPLIAVSALIAAALSFALYREDINQTLDTAFQEESEQQDDIQQSHNLIPIPNPDEDNQSIWLDPEPQEQQADNQDAPPAAPPAEETELAQTSTPQAVPPKPEVSKNPPLAKTEEPEVKPPAANVTAQTQAAPKTAAQEKPQPKVKPETEKKPAPAPVVAKVEQKPQAAPQKPKPQNKAPLSVGNRVLARTDGRAYTIQLFSSPNEKTSDKLIKDHNLGKNALVFQHERKDETWHTLLFGLFPSKQQADKVAQSLATRVKVTPWVRQVKDIQDQLGYKPVVTQRQNPPATQQQSAAAAPAQAQPQTAQAAPNQAVAASTPVKHNVPPPLLQRPDPSVLKAANDIGPQLGIYEDWLMGVNEEHFTLQLLSTQNLHTVRKFIETRGIYDDIAVFRTMRSGRIWYALVYGDYAERSDATKAVRNLPAALRGMSPWIRSVASIQEDITQVHAQR